MTGPSRMAAEIAEIPAAAARLCDPARQERLREAARALRDLAPPAVLTVARGSSDHAATCLKYAIELSLRRPVASVGPSVVSVHDVTLHVPGMAALAISQSGASTDLRLLTERLRQGGARTFALVNRADSALAAAADMAIDVAAGPERAVAATKSFVNSLLAGLWIVSHWAGDAALAEALRAIPEALAGAVEGEAEGVLFDWLCEAGPLTVLGRGPALGLALEAALKAREVLARPAEAFSAAEVLHGPGATIAEGHQVMVLGDPVADGAGAARAQVAAQGARWLAVEDVQPPPPVRHRLTDALPQLARCYAAVERAARARGLDPDRPRFLKKETITV